MVLQRMFVVLFLFHCVSEFLKLKYRELTIVVSSGSGTFMSVCFMHRRVCNSLGNFTVKSR